MIRYYLTQRAPMPGAFPGKPVNMEAYDDRKYVTEIGKCAWGWVEYQWPLTEKEVGDYELTRPIKFNIIDLKTTEILVTVSDKEIANRMFVHMQKKYPEKKLWIGIFRRDGHDERSGDRIHDKSCQTDKTGQ